MNPPSDFPPSLGLAGAELMPVHLGMSGAGVWRVRRPEQADAYLKASGLPPPDAEPIVHDSLDYDRQILCWLKSRAPVPEVLAYLAEDGMEYLLMEALPGQPACDDIFRDDDKTLRLLAESLRSLHALPIGECPFVLPLTRRITLARARMEAGLVDEDNFETIRAGLPATELYERLIATPPLPEDRVFCHGDACLPNFILFQGRLSGWIDVGRAGVSDRWQDLALFCRSLRHGGYSEAQVARALEYYGEPMNPEKYELYVLLDEFF